jgi:hypothetical protein
MQSVQRTIFQSWEVRRKAMLVVAAVTSGLLIALLDLALAAEPLKVGGLPVT